MEKEKLYNILAILCGLWFGMVGVLWTYYMNLVLAYPVGILGFYFWYQASKIKKGVLNRIALSILIAGLVCSLGALWLYQ